MALADEIRRSEKSRRPVETTLSTDEKVLARITDGIYRQPASALRELISNAYDADATEVVLLTDAPRFSQISIRDNGRGLSPEIVEHLIRHIGGSAKRSEQGKQLGVTAKSDLDRSPGGRQLIGKLGIGLFSVAQFTRHFLIITKQKGDKYRTVADITLGSVAGQQKQRYGDTSQGEIETGHARIWRERAVEEDANGTEIKLLDLLPRTRAELASDDLWTRIEFEGESEDQDQAAPPTWHIGRMKPRQEDVLAVQPSLPWSDEDSSDKRFVNLLNAVRDVAAESDSVDLDSLFDKYLQTVWTLALSAPLDYCDGHPFDFKSTGEFEFFLLENSSRGQPTELELSLKQSPRSLLKLQAPKFSGTEPFNVFIDGMKLCRPLLFKNLPRTKSAVATPLIFIGRHAETFAKKPPELSGGPLKFEAYLFWSPRIIPKQHQGVMLRVGNASGALFDRTFMGYQVSEQQRTRQITAEIFVHEGLDGAINIDRESFNYAHPHYQYLVKWLHSALRQLANKHKEIGKNIRGKRIAAEGKKVRALVEHRVEKALKARGVDDIAEVVLLEPAQESDVRKLRKEGTIALRKSLILPIASMGRLTTTEMERRKLAEKKAVAIAQLLSGWGLLEKLSYTEQEALLRDILEIVLMDN